MQQSPNDTLKFDSGTISTGVSLVMNDFEIIGPPFLEWKNITMLHYTQNLEATCL